MLKRFLFRSVVFVGLIVPATFGLALLASPAYPAADGCAGSLQRAQVSLAAVETRVQRTGSVDDDASLCSVNQLYFFELVKARAVMASCEQGPERDRVLGRLDADVEHINRTIAATCH